MTRKKGNVVDFTERRETSDQVLERLFSQHEAALRTFVRRRLGSVEEIEDVVQEVFARLARLGDLHTRIQAGKGDGRSYLFTVANNLIVDQERRKTLQRQYDNQTDEGDLVTEVTPETIVATDRELEIIKQVIMNLKPSWRRAFVLNRFHYMSYREVAEHMGITIKQVESYMAQALVKLRDAERAMENAVREGAGEQR